MQILKIMSTNRLLVISEKGLGDALTLLPALRALKLQRPETEIFMFAPGLFRLAENYRDWLQLLDHRWLSAATTTEMQDWLQRQDFRWVWNTENEHSAWRGIFAAAGNPRWVSAPPHRTWPRRPVLELRRAQLQTLFPDLPTHAAPALPLTTAQQQGRDQFRSQFAATERLIAIQPSANDHTKVWPAEKFRQLAQTLITRPATTVVFFLDTALAEIFIPELLGSLPNIVRVCEPLETALAKLAACDIFVGNDSGFYHLAYALGVPVVGIYRSRRNMKVWAYRSPRARAVWVYLPSSIRRHWQKVVSVRAVRRAVAALGV